MKKIKKINIVLSSTLAISFSLVPIVALNSINFNTKGKISNVNPGFNIETPNFSNSFQFDKAQIINGEFTRSMEAVENPVLTNGIGPNNEFISKTRVSSLSKNFIWTNGLFNVNFYKTFFSNGNNADVDPNQPESIIATGINGTINNGNTTNMYSKTLLATGTGQPNPIFNQIHQGVLAAQFIGNQLWLLTSGAFSNSNNYMLQVYDASSTLGVPNINHVSSTPLSFVGTSPESLLSNPPVISPIYKMIDGKPTIKPNEVFIWQQNNAFNSLDINLISLDGTNFTKTQKNIGNLDGTHSTLAITPIEDGLNRQYYVHSSGTNGIALSKFDDLSTLEETIILSDKSIDGMDVNNEMPYAKLVGQSGNFELVWIFPNTNGSQIFSTTIENNTINTAKSTAHNLGNRIVHQVQYMDIQSNGENYLSLKLNNPNDQNFSVSSLVNLNELKVSGKTFEDANNDIFLNSDPAGISANKLQDVSHIFSLKENYINYSYIDGPNEYQQERLFNNLEKIPFKTSTPTTIITNVGLNNLTGDQVFSTIIQNATKNLLWVPNPLDAISIHGKIFIPDDLENLEGSGSFQVIYSYGRGSYNDQGILLTPPESGLYIPGQDGQLGPLPVVGDGVSPFQIASIIHQNPNSLIPLEVAINLPSSYSNLSPSKFTSEIMNVLGDGTIPPSFENDPKYNGLIGSKETDVIQITNAYLPSLVNMSIQADDFLGKINIISNFSNPNIVSGQTSVLVNADGFFGNVFYIYTIIPSIVGVVIIIWITIIILAKKKRSKDMSLALSSGFRLSQKLSKVKPDESITRKSIIAQNIHTKNSPNGNSKIQQPINQVGKPHINMDPRNIPNSKNQINQVVKPHINMDPRNIPNSKNQINQVGKPHINMDPRNIPNSKNQINQVKSFQKPLPPIKKIK